MLHTHLEHTGVNMLSFCTQVYHTDTLIKELRWAEDSLTCILFALLYIQTCCSVMQAGAQDWNASGFLSGSSDVLSA